MGVDPTTLLSTGTALVGRHRLREHRPQPGRVQPGGADAVAVTAARIEGTTNAPCRSVISSPTLVLMTVFVETLSKGDSVHCIGLIVKAVDLTARAIVPSCRKARGARTRGRTGRHSAPREYAAWGLVHIKAARVSDGFCTPYQSMRRDPRIYSCDAGMVARLRIFCITELYTAYPEACPLIRPTTTACLSPPMPSSSTS